MQSENLGIFIPAYEAELTLERVVQRIPSTVLERCDMVLIQDDASTDRTWEVAARLAEHDRRIVAVRNERNLGFGGTNKKAFEALRESEIAAFAVLHGDLQYDPELLIDVFGPIVADRADIVLGSRMSGTPLRGRMPVERWLANRALTWLMNRKLGLRLTDYHTGLVALRTAVLDDLDIETLSAGHEITAEILIRAALLDKRIVEVTIPTNYHAEGRSLTRWTGARYAWNVVRMLDALPSREGTG